MSSIFFDVDHNPKPKYRGISHKYGFFLALASCIAMWTYTPTEKVWPILIYCIGFCGMLGTSTCYHRLSWSSAGEKWIRRADYVMISFKIASAFTPFCMLVFSSWYSLFVMYTLWLGVVLCALLHFVWVDSPNLFRTAVYIVSGWVGVPLFPELIETCGVTCAVLALIGGFLYTIGGLIYAFRWPDPAPNVFGYHEIFHACVVVAAFIHFYCIWTYAL